VSAIRRQARPPQNTRLGGDIFIHGNGSQGDWTWGCVALDDPDMKELFDAVPLKAKVVIEH
jgi:L,D-peptidoglycan transpeptidase YkuD (ErfK/YbiS/YcfS/YnhG family)